jgi:UDP-N-acetylmuramate dehydrogenase
MKSPAEMVHEMKGIIPMRHDMTQAYEWLYPHFQERIRRKEWLKRHSSFGVGGQADIWVSVETQKELKDLIGLCTQENWPLLVVGAGTNILYADAGVQGIVARLAFRSYRIEENDDHSATVIAEAGVHWAQLLHQLVSHGWGGLEFGVGIPGTLGAGIVSNAGAHHQDLAQTLEWIEVLDARGCNAHDKDQFTQPIVRRYLRDELDLGYRHSRFRESRYTHIDQTGQLVLPSRGLIEPAEIVLTLGLHAQKQDPDILLALVDQHKQDRKNTEPALRYLGSIFKDPPGQTARALIEQAGLRGKRHGQAQISELNGNYIVNLGGARAIDIATLAIEAHQQVLKQFSVHLALNIDLQGEWSTQGQLSVTTVTSL